MMKIVLGVLVARPAGDDANRVTADLASLGAGRLFGAVNALRAFLKRCARGLQKESVAISYCESLTGRRRAGIHDQGAGAAIGFRLAANAFHIEVLAVKIEILTVGPDHFDDVDPFLRIIVTLLMRALLDAEHVELALVPADYDIESKAALADMIGSDHFLRRDHRIENRRVDGAEHRDALGAGEQGACPGDGFERGSLIVGDPAISLPAADRKEKIDAGLVCQQSQFLVIRPAA